MTQLLDIAWPPEYKIKKHRRARHVKLRASQQAGLEITVPWRFNVNEIPDILEKNKNWITKQLRKHQTPITDTLPEQIVLFGGALQWKITYLFCDTKLELIERPDQELVLVGRITDKTACKKKLKEWIKNKAKLILIEKLILLSKQTNLAFESVQIRSQKTLWGSCTVAKAISLNVKLIFLAEEVIRYVIIHELCHTKHLNHSARFWTLVGKHDPDYENHRRALRYADDYIPWNLL